MNGLFITGTDTDVGKTFIAGCIAAACVVRGYRCGVYKPFASGGVWKDGKLVSEDALFLMRAAQIDDQLYKEVNHICLEPSLTPAVAAELSNVTIDIEKTISDLHKSSEKYDFIVVEGVGGIAAPLWKNYLVADFIRDIDLPALIVSHAGIGTINHTVLTHSYGISRGINMSGYIFNGAKVEVGTAKSNSSYIQAMTKMQCLGCMPNISLVADNDLAKFAEKYLNINEIIKYMKGV